METAVVAEAVASEEVMAVAGNSFCCLEVDSKSYVAHVLFFVAFLSYGGGGGGGGYGGSYGGGGYGGGGYGG